jgi:hypothetical protein
MMDEHSTRMDCSTIAWRDARRGAAWSTVGRTAGAYRAVMQTILSWLD